MFTKFLARLKALPRAAKIVLGILMVGLIYGAAHQEPKPYGGGRDIVDSNNPTVVHSGNDGSSALATLQAQHDRLSRQATDCVRQMNENQANWAAAAMNGQMPVSQPECAAQMATWAAQMKSIEIEEQRLEGGGGYYAGGGGGSYGGGAQPNLNHPMDSSYIDDMQRNSDRALESADRYDRNAIRETSMYTDANGNQVELPTQNYYSQNDQTGAYVGSQNNTVPNDTSTYTPMTNNDSSPE